MTDLYGGGGGGGGQSASSSASSSSAISFGSGSIIGEDGGLTPLGIIAVSALGLFALLGLMIVAKK